MVSFVIAISFVWKESYMKPYEISSGYPPIIEGQKEVALGWHAVCFVLFAYVLSDKLCLTIADIWMFVVIPVFLLVHQMVFRILHVNFSSLTDILYCIRLHSMSVHMLVLKMMKLILLTWHTTLSILALFECIRLA